MKKYFVRHLVCSMRLNSHVQTDLYTNRNNKNNKNNKNKKAQSRNVNSVPLARVIICTCNYQTIFWG